MNIYKEICSELNRDGWQASVCEIRNFLYVNVANVKLSIFISGNVLYIINGTKIPPIIHKENIETPHLDIIKFICHICKKKFSSPEII